MAKTFLSINIMQIFLSKNYEDVSSGSEYDSAKRTVSRHKNNIWDLLLNKSKSFEWKVSL